jgi:hypothetical protein
MPENPVTRILLAFAMIIAGLAAVYFGFHNPLAFGLGVIAAVGGVLVMMDFGNRHPNR